MTTQAGLGLLEANRAIYKLITQNTTTDRNELTGEQSPLLRLVDFHHPERNSFINLAGRFRRRERFICTMAIALLHTAAIKRKRPLYAASLIKPDKLTASEFATMKNHTVYGHRDPAIPLVPRLRDFGIALKRTALWTSKYRSLTPQDMNSTRLRIPDRSRNDQEGDPGELSS